MNDIPLELIIIFIVGFFLIIVAGVQLYVGKVYTRGGRGVKWHKDTIVSKEEAPLVFWSIIGLQSLIGVGVVITIGFVMYNKLY